MALQPVWFVGERRAFGSGTVGAGHESDKEQGRGAQFAIDTDDSEYHQFFAGINEDNSMYHLQKGETFKTPVLALTYSDEGLGGASRNFHRWGRTYKLAHGDKPRKFTSTSTSKAWNR